MGHARGVIVLAVATGAGSNWWRLKPAEVKKSLVGHGRASKAQVQDAIQRQFGLDSSPRAGRIVADALAIALCALRRPAIEIGRPAGTCRLLNCPR